MFTDCPACNRLFRINATLLSAAGGQVKCGYCGKQFNALERLYDTPLTPHSSDDTFIDERNTDNSDIQFDIPEQSPMMPVEDSIATDMDRGKSDNSQNIMEVPETDAIRPLDRAEKIQDYHAHAFNGEIMEDELVQEMLIEESSPRSGLFTRMFWFSGILVLILTVVSMVAWFQRDAVLSRYPQWAPMVYRLCEHLNCSVIRFRDVSAIELINRDVRDHPRYENALLVNATMSNRTLNRQPYPDIQLSLFDTNGVLIAHRIFKPDDYLDDSIDVLQGMPPEIPVHFVLEVTGPTEGAVSFEFKFL